jgi:hypothetical protein
LGRATHWYPRLDLISEDKPLKWVFPKTILPSHRFAFQLKEDLWNALRLCRDVDEELEPKKPVYYAYFRVNLLVSQVRCFCWLEFRTTSKILALIAVDSIPLFGFLLALSGLVLLMLINWPSSLWGDIELSLLQVTWNCGEVACLPLAALFNFRHKELGESSLCASFGNVCCSQSETVPLTILMQLFSVVLFKSEGVSDPFLNSGIFITVFMSVDNY